MKTNYFLSIIAAGMVLAACSKKLNEVSPDTQVRFETLTDQDLPYVINGIYLALTNNSYHSYFYLHDMMSDDVEALSGSAYNDNAVSVSDNTAGLNYQYAYRAIANANVVIRYAEGKSDPAVLQASAEAKFLRAYCYLRLVQYYGGLPIKLGGEPSSDKPKRQTEEQVYELMSSDLQAAATVLPDFTAGSSYKTSKQAAQALLARVYLQTGKYAEAKAEALKVISSGKFALDNNFAAQFSYASTSADNIFRIGENGVSSNSGLALVYNSNNAAGNTWIDSNLVNSYEPSDMRKALFAYRLNPNLGLSVYYCTKFPAEQNHAYPVLRYSEVLLMAAEADARMGTIDVTHYNTLRTVRKASTKANNDFATPQDFLNELERERRREFVGEALRWQDMRRFGTAIPFLQAKSKPGGYVLLPIPEREIFLNPNMKQNPDY
jgi:starch-binding outer membrane protein, SusD/RagB family